MRRASETGGETVRRNEPSPARQREKSCQAFQNHLNGRVSAGDLAIPKLLRGVLRKRAAERHANSLQCGMFALENGSGADCTEENAQDLALQRGWRGSLLPVGSMGCAPRRIARPKSSFVNV